MLEGFRRYFHVSFRAISLNYLSKVNKSAAFEFWNEMNSALCHVYRMLPVKNSEKLYL